MSESGCAENEGCCNGDANGSNPPVPSSSSPKPSHCDPNDPNCLVISDTHCVLANSPAPLPPNTPESKASETARKLGAEFLGTLLLVLVVVSSGISAENLTDDVGLQLLINAFATTAGLYGLIVVFGPVSGAHFNPIVSLVDALYGDMQLWTCGLYWMAQVAGGIVGCILSNVQYDIPIQISDKERFGYELFLSELIATTTLVLVIHGCIRTGSESSVPAVVSLWVGGGYFFTSSSIFANPAVTIGRMFTKSFAGIEPTSAGVYVGMQFAGAIFGYGLTRLFYPQDVPSLKRDDNLYRRACVLELKGFYTKGAY